MEIKVIGAGLAGVEAAYQIAKRGQSVTLYEMRPQVFTPAHKTAYLSELVCSNSLKSRELTNAHGLLKEELRRLDSIIIRAADKTSIPGGKALVVDRTGFAETVTEEVEAHPLIHLVREEISRIPDGVVVVATGPLTSAGLAEEIGRATGMEHLSFFDAISPILDGETIDIEQAFFASRYTQGAGDYLNCPLTEGQYDLFYEELTHAERVALKEFEKVPYFEGCLPIEVMAERGKKTLLYGPMKPVGLREPKTGKEPYGVVQLRKEDASGAMYNMVGFQTKLTQGEQERVFRLIPALKNAEFFRHGSVHRNTYINAPAVLTKGLCLAQKNDLFFAGQITGVEGYVESAAMGLLAGISACLSTQGKTFPPPPENTCVGALLRYITTEAGDFQPMNINFGILKDYRKRNKEKAVNDALSAIEEWSKAVDNRA
jgi:methylenetetrahydrofolate--tRNA-(uracil-5-)-methyltransferase